MLAGEAEAVEGRKLGFADLAYPGATHTRFEHALGVFHNSLRYLSQLSRDARFRAVVEDYQTTVHTAEALHRLVESYLSLGLTDEARTAAAILGHNFQGTEWYDASYKLLNSQGLEPGEAGQGWLTRIYRQVIQGKWV